MTAKDYLSQYKRIDQRIQRKYEKIERMRSLACKTTSTLKDICVLSTHDNSKIENIIIRLDMMERDINADIDMLVEFKQEILSNIIQIENEKLQMILIFRYISGWDWETIAKIINEPCATTRGKLHSKALSEITRYCVDKL